MLSMEYTDRINWKLFYLNVFNSYYRSQFVEVYKDINRKNGCLMSPFENSGDYLLKTSWTFLVVIPTNILFLPLAIGFEGLILFDIKCISTKILVDAKAVLTK